MRPQNESTNNKPLIPNEDVVKGNWKQVKGEFQKAWGNITDDQFEQTKGDLTKLGGIVQEKYGHTKDKFASKLDEILNKFRDSDSTREASSDASRRV